MAPWVSVHLIRHERQICCRVQNTRIVLRVTHVCHSPVIDLNEPFFVVESLKDLKKSELEHELSVLVGEL